MKKNNKNKKAGNDDVYSNRKTNEISEEELMWVSGGDFSDWLDKIHEIGKDLYKKTKPSVPVLPPCIPDFPNLP